mmetsp:Transcript_64635/g.107098  ORF Transcript_64635/g.107098 Transcript_64635/m.107098 type:complete len:87 (+) Transcript_64635:360-620(+)
MQPRGQPNHSCRCSHEWAPPGAQRAEAKQLTGPYLRRRLMAMRPSAMGLDGWSLHDLRALPDRVLHWLAQLLTLIEEMGQWPTLLA